MENNEDMEKLINIYQEQDQNVFGRSADNTMEESANSSDDEQMLSSSLKNTNNSHCNKVKNKITLDMENQTINQNPITPSRTEVAEPIVS